MAGFTKKAISEAFLKLLNEQPLNQITVKAIVDECGVNRNTFYYHFEDIPHLMESIVREEAESIIRAHSQIESLEDCFDVTMEFVQKHRKAALNVYHSVSRDVFEQYQWRICAHAAQTLVDGVLAGRRISEEDRTAIIDYVKCVNFGIVIGWLDTRLNTAAMERFRRVFELKKGDLERLLERCMDS